MPLKMSLLFASRGTWEEAEVNGFFTQPSVRGSDVISFEATLVIFMTPTVYYHLAC